MKKANRHYIIFLQAQAAVIPILMGSSSLSNRYKLGVGFPVCIAQEKKQPSSQLSFIRKVSPLDHNVKHEEREGETANVTEGNLKKWDAKGRRKLLHSIDSNRKLKLGWREDTTSPPKKSQDGRKRNEGYHGAMLCYRENSYM